MFFCVDSLFGAEGSTQKRMLFRLLTEAAASHKLRQFKFQSSRLN